MTRRLSQVAALATSLAVLPAFASAGEEHGHDHVDIDLLIEGTRLEVEATAFSTLVAFGGYTPLYEAEFSTDGTNPTIDDPGILLEDAPAGTQLFANLGAFYEFTGGVWAPAIDAFIELDSTLNFPTLGGTATADGSGPVSGSPLFVGAAAVGADHVHNDFTLFSSTGTPSVGAYLLELYFSVDAPGVGDSERVLIAFNNGLDETAFEDGAVAALAPVPLPAGVWLLASALVGLGTIARRTQRS